MPCNYQWSKCSKVATVFESEKTEWDDDEEDSLLVDMPSEEEGCEGAHRDGTHEVVPVGLHERLDKADLKSRQQSSMLVSAKPYQLEE